MATHRDRMSKSSTTEVIGRPGSHAAGLARHHGLYAAGLAVAGMALALGALALLPGAAALVPGVVAVVLFGLAQAQWGLSRRARVGADSEKRVARVVEALAPSVVVHGADLGSGGDADHVLLGPVCVVIETKTGRGKFRRQGNKVLVGAKVLPRDPVRQVQNQARLLASKTGRYVDAVVCVVDMTGPPVHLDNAWVCSLADLAKVVHQLPASLTPDRAREIARTITPSS